ncbi:hypothetical protein ACOTWR_06040 [Aliarcobacter butzleri]
MTDKRILSKEEIKRSLDELLEDCQVIRFEGTNTYIVDDVKFIQIKKLYACSEFLMQIEEDIIKSKAATKEKSKEVKKVKKKGAFYKFGKILNFSEFPIIAYKTFLKHKYVNITNPEKVKEQIKREYAIALAETENHYEKIINDNKESVDEDFINKINTEMNTKLTEIRSEKKFIDDNFEEIDIRITTFKEENLYPHIRLIDANGEESIDFLRAEVPNIIYAHRNMFFMKDGYRKDAKHIKFAIEAKHAFGEVFYKEK